MTTLIFLLFGIIAMTLVQIDVVHYRYLKSRTPLPDSIRIDMMFNSPRRKFLRVVVTLLGLGLLFLSVRSCLENTPAEQYPMLLSIILTFILWIVVLHIFIKFVLKPNRPLTATSISLTFILPLVLIGLVYVIAHIFPNPEIEARINDYQAIHKSL